MKFMLVHPVFSLSGSGNWVWGAERRKEKRKERRAKRRERERERPTTQWSRDLWGSPSLLALPLSLFHTLVFKILAQWSFFNEFAPVVAINWSVMVLKQVVISCPIEHLARVGWTSN